MNAIIDTSSLRALVNYYLPFDKNNALKGLLEHSFETGNLIFLDKVVAELRSQGSGRFYKELDFLSNTSPLCKHIVATDALLPYPKFITRVDDHFCYKEFKKSKNITDSQYEILKQKFLDGADAKIILYAKTLQSKQQPLFGEPKKVLVVSEESSTPNDGKIFKKIPVICEYMSITCCTLPELLRDHYELKLSEFFH